jgi:hypothetical protein
MKTTGYPFLLRSFTFLLGRSLSHREGCVKFWQDISRPSGGERPAGGVSGCTMQPTTITPPSAGLFLVDQLSPALGSPSQSNFEFDYGSAEMFKFKVDSAVGRHFSSNSNRFKEWMVHVPGRTIYQYQHISDCLSL